jgi:hypothetical protein
MIASMDATVSVWVPLVVAGVGLLTTLAGVVYTRWADRKDRRDQWRREDTQRWLPDRQEAYARLMAALAAWDASATQAIARRHTDAVVGERSAFDSAEWQKLRQATRDAQGLVELLAPESVRGIARMAEVRRDWLRVSYLTEENVSLDEMDEFWKEALKVTTALRNAMRKDLGLAAEDDNDAGRQQIAPGT